MFPAQLDPSLAANVLEIFTGTATFEQWGSDDRALKGIVRVRLGFQLTPSIKYVGSATVASLASVSGNSDRSLWAVDRAEVATDRTGPPDDPGRDPKGLPQNELFLFLYAAVYGEEAALLRLAYQSNVLIDDTTPDLDSILVRTVGSQAPFAPTVSVQPGEAWEYQLTLTGPADHLFTAHLGSDSGFVPIVNQRTATTAQLGLGQQSGAWTASPTDAAAPDVPDCTITAIGKRATRTATVSVRRLR